MSRFLLVMLLAGVVRPVDAQTPASCAPGQASDILDANNVRAALYNNGVLFWKGAANVYNVPKAPPGAPITPNALFSANLWFGGYEGSELRQASATTQNWEYVPGPLGPGGQLPPDCRPYDRISRVTLNDLHALARGTITDAVRNWPHAWGAPVVDGDGVTGNYNLAGGDRPELLGTESHWWVMNAAGPHPRTGSKPFPLEVQVTAFAMPSLPGFTPFVPALNNSTLYRYRLVWKGAAPMTDAYIGIGADPDLGNAVDDYVGSDTTLRMGFAYNADNVDEGSDGYGLNPPALGLLALNGPLLHDDDRDGRPERHGFTSFLYYNSGSGRASEPRGNTGDYYNYMRARWQDGVPAYACGDGAAAQFAPCGTTRWLLPGDPVTKSFWSEFMAMQNATTPNAPSDRKIALGMGPFTLQPNVPQDVVFAFVWARGTNHLASVTDLKRDAAAIQRVWDAGGFSAWARQPAPPIQAPSATLDVGDVWPLPVRTTGHLRIGLPTAVSVRVWIVDVLGRTVLQLHDGPMPAGISEVPVEASRLAPGVYAVRVGIGSAVVSRPLIVGR